MRPQTKIRQNEFMYLRTLSLSLLALLFLSSKPAVAGTGSLGFAVGIATGIGAIDFSDGTNRWNVGGVMTQVNFGLHTGDFAFLVEASILNLQGRIYDYFADVGGALKWYMVGPVWLKGKIGFSRYEFMTYSGNITTISSYYGGSVGFGAGWDIVGQDNQPFRLSLSAGAQRADFGSMTSRQGNDTSGGDLGNHVTGLVYYGLIGLDWYL
jgi:hypothetical protein